MITNNNETFTEIDVLRSKCLNDFSFFVRYFFKKLNNKRFNVSTHHNQLFDIATNVNKHELKNVIINIAPRYGKTEIMVKMFISWSLAINPSARFIHLSYSDSLALDNSSEIKSIITSAEYQQLFPYVQISKDSRAKEKWYTTAGGGVLARSSSGQVTGFGAGQTDFDAGITEFGGAIVIDDPIKPDDANSETLRNAVNNKFNTTIRNRVNSEKTPIIIIMQRLHPEDLCGYLIENEPNDWEVIRMPVINEDGSALWEAKHTIEVLNDMREKLGLIFETQYMQDPQPIEGYLIPFKTLSLLPNEHDGDFIKRMVFVDPAEKNGDRISAIFCNIEQYNDRFNVHVYDVVHTTSGFEVASEVIHKKAIDTDVSEIIFEKNGVGLALGVAMKNLNKDNKYKLTPYHETQNKDAKILNNYEFVKKYYSFSSSYEKNSNFVEYVKHLTQFSSEKQQAHKRDAMDVACSSARILKVMFSKHFTT